MLRKLFCVNQSVRVSTWRTVGIFNFVFVLSKLRRVVCRSSEATGCKSMGNSCRAGWERHSDSGNYNNRKQERWLLLARLWYLWPVIVKG